MAGRIPQNFIDDIISRLDIVDVVTARTRLKKTGKNYSACCPFHNEKTPSFTVSPDKQFYYCFGCGATGTALKFIMEFDGLSFPDAVEKVAQDLGIEVPREGGNDFQQSQRAQHEPLYKLMAQATDFFEQQLKTSAHKDKAINYLKGRGLSGQAAKFFQIGYAAPGWDNLQNHLAPADSDKQSETIKNLITCGMTIEKEDGRTYDRFRDRVMFPIRNVKGQIIAFGGRVLGDEKPKYLNSPETPIFHKNQELYGLYEARKIRQKLTRMVIVEGYMDVVALAEFGIHYAVATLGTATSEHHIRRLFKVVPEIIFCFDGDNAGRTAAKRAMETTLPALKDGLQARFLFLPDGEDPDTLVRKEGKQAFEKRLDESKHLPEFLFEQLKEQVDFDSLDGKARLGQLAAPLIAKLPKGMLKELMQQKLSQETGIKEEKLAELLPEEDETPPSAAAPKPIQTPQHQPSAVYSHTTQTPASQPAGLPDYYSPEDDEVDVGDFIDAPAHHSSKEDAQLQALVARALRMLAQNPGCAAELDSIEEIEGEDDQEILFLQLIKQLNQAPQSGVIGLLTHWTGKAFFEEIKAAATDTIELPTGVNPAGEINGVLKKLTLRHLRREWQMLQNKVRQKQKLTPEERLRYKELPQQLKNHKN
jgi:DNA primase